MSGLRRALTALLTYFALAATAATGQAATLPAGFSDATIARPDGQPWDDAVGLTFAADGRLYVWERAGRVWLVDPAQPHRTPLIDLSGEVGSYGELGLTGFALDPAFATNGRLYLFYTVDAQHLASCDSPRSGPVVCHAQAHGAVHGPFSATISRIARYTLARPANGDLHQATAVDASSRVVLLGESAAGGLAAAGAPGGVGSDSHCSQRDQASATSASAPPPPPTPTPPPTKPPEPGCWAVSVECWMFSPSSPPPVAVRQSPPGP